MSDEKRCANCRHWGAKGGDYSQSDLHKICGRIMLMDYWEADDELAFVQDGSGYIGRLWTKPDFACVQWEPKE